MNQLVGGMKTSAVREGNDWVIDGVKRWITNAGESESYTVMAVADLKLKTRGGISAFVVKKSDEGVSFRPRKGSSESRARPPARVRTGFVTAMKSLDRTRGTIAARAVGVVERMMRDAKIT